MRPTRRTRCQHAPLLLLTASLLPHLSADAFLSPSVRCSMPKPFLSLSRVSASYSEEDDDPDMSLSGPEKSRMTDFIAEFLQKEKAGQGQEISETPTSGNTSYTHLVAMPVDACHELLLELESVQRAILYHCPILVHACITQAMTRLPLLYVQTDNSARATTILHNIVQDVVREHIFVDASKEEPSHEVKKDDGGPDFAGANADGIKPLLMTFQSLEIDGAANEVLHTVADEKCEGTVKLQRLVEELQEKIQKETGWETIIPLDPQSADTFRPRIPFMRLPNNWEDYLEKTEEDELLTSDQGGNGISPIFWCQWWDDVFGEARMREVAVYKRREGYDGLDEDAFYLPDRSVALPDGNAALTKQEARFQEYNEQRMKEAEALEVGNEDSVEPVPVVADDDPLLVKTRDRLESLYQSSSVNTFEEIDIVSRPADVDEEEEDEEEDELEETYLSLPKERPADPNDIDDWTRERIKKAVAARARVQSEIELAKPKDKPPISENEIFSKYKEGTLVPKEEEPAPARELPPYPSREHVVGFWRVVSSPTGFAVEEGDSSRCDNLVLRVDGTTAGGPILDQETRQKASGGTWRLKGDTPDTAELRIRLVIPPKKERIMVMKGMLERVSMSSELPLASSTFGIPALEEKAAKANEDYEDLLYCSGTVWIEDAVTGEHRNEIGSFSLMKLYTPSDPGQYTITIPRPVRNQD